MTKQPFAILAIPCCLLLFVQIFQMKNLHFYRSSGATASIPSSLSNFSSPSCSPCIQDYISTMKTIGVENGVSYDEWQAMLCQQPSALGDISDKALIVGLGPGTTASRSFALALSLLGKDVLHYAARRNGYGEKITEWNDALKQFRVLDLVRGMASVDSWNRTGDVNFAMYEKVDAVFDWPVPMYVTDILRKFPNAKILMTHRDPVVWYAKRRKFCLGQSEKLCDVPFVLRPVKMHLADMTEYQSIKSFEATVEAVQCLVPPDHFLQVDAWSPPTSHYGWMPAIADFLEVEMPPPESQCTIPQNADHVLSCGQDAACQSCRSYMMKRLHLARNTS